MQSRERTKIYTFYSYKGGVGRSMALANIAELLYRKGLSVLMIDFDLEAPGLEQYFFDRTKPDEQKRLEEVCSKRGIIDLLFSYKSLRALHKSLPSPQSHAGPNSENVFSFAGLPMLVSAASDPDSADPTLSALPFPIEPLDNFITDIYSSSQTNPARLSLITAGQRARERLSPENNQKELVEEFAHYADQVRSFAWGDFYLNCDGELFFEWFRNEAISKADVVLIDSRTGVAEMSGVCTYQLADIAVMFVASNNQNVDGIRKIAESLTTQELISEGRSGRKLSLIFIPSRVDLGEKRKLDDLTERFRQMADSLISTSLTFETNSFADLKIPYIPYYSFVEEVAVRDSNSTAAIELTKAYERICRSLAQLDPVVGAKFRTEPNTADVVNTSEQLNRSAESLFGQLTPAEQLITRSLFTRLVRVARIEEGDVRDTLKNAKVNDLSSDQMRIAGKFMDQGLLTRIEDASGQPTVGLTDERLLNDWSRLKDWVNDDREFLLWRQGLQSAAAAWDKDGRRDIDLLVGSKSEEAEKWLSAREKDLNEFELNYIRASSSLRRNNKLRFVLTRASLALVAVLFLGTIYFYGYRPRFRASDTGVEARSRKLAVTSEALSTTQPEISLALAIEASRLAPTTEAQQALKDAISQANLRTIVSVGGNVSSARFSHDGRRFVTAASGGKNPSAAVWESNGDKGWMKVLTLEGHKDEVTRAIFSPDDRLIATASYDGSSIIWDASSGRLIARLSASSAPIADISFSQDGSLLAAASKDNRVYVWDVQKKQLVSQQMPFRDDVKSVDFIGEMYLATDGTGLTLGDGSTLKPLPLPLESNKNPILDAGFSTHGQFVVTTTLDGTVTVLSTKTWQTVSTFSGHTLSVNRASFSPNDQLVVTASNDGTAMILDARSGKLLSTLRGSPRAINDASFSPDGKLVLTAGADGTARVWDVNVDFNPNTSLGELQTYACSRLTRNMSKPEWQQYASDETPKATCPKLPFP